EQDTLKADNSIQLAITYAYDGAGRRITQTDPPAIVPDPGGSDPTGVGNVTTTTYDANGNVLEVKKTNSRLSSAVSDSTSTYDKLNRPLTKTEQANTTSAQTTTSVYNIGGQLTSVMDPTGNTTTYTYDALGRTLTVTHPDSTQDTYTYYPDGKQKTKVNNAGTTSDSYDVLGRLISEVSGNPQTTATYTCDANGNKLTEIDNFPGGTNTTITWTYDPLDRQKTMNDGVRSFTYDVNGNVTQMVVNVPGTGNAVEADMTYDGSGRLTTLVDKVSMVGSTLHSYSYQYDLQGNQTQIMEDSTTTTYQYDQLNQLTTVTQGATSITYKYDANGNRVSMKNGSSTTTYTYDTADVNLLSKTDPNGKVTNYTYDLVNGKSNGNLIKSVYDPGGTGHANQTTNYTYDTNNRLKTMQLPNGTLITYAYDADGNRVSKAVTVGSTTTTVLDVYSHGRLAYQTDGSGNKIASYNYDQSGVPESVDLTTSAGIVRYYYVYNGHGDVVALVDGNGTSRATYSYDEFGVLKTGSSESFPNNTYNWTNPYRYDGKDRVRYDTETGLYWMSVRAYDPTLGRFITHDPLGRLAKSGMDIQPYVYASNNPLINTDPSGMLISGGQGSGQTAIRTSSGRVIITSGGSIGAQIVGSGKKRGSAHLIGSGIKRTGGGGGHQPNAQGPTAATATNLDGAKNAAQDASDDFTIMGAAVAGADLFILGLSFLLSVQGIEDFITEYGAPLGITVEWLSAQLRELAGMGAGLGIEIGLLAYLFGSRSTRPDSWWTTDNLLGFASEIHGIVNVAKSIFAGISALAGGLSATIPVWFQDVVFGGAFLGAYLGYFVNVNFIEPRANSALGIMFADIMPDNTPH
ncbi:MAG TPA: RHS repeat-associated core domain-containing protein, partial [Ktedonobacteraceae bacterium]